VIVARGGELGGDGAETRVLGLENLLAQALTRQPEKGARALQALARFVDFRDGIRGRHHLAAGALDLLGSDAPEAFLNRFVEFETKGHFEARARG
jgi:hypothetical protein